MDYTKGYKKASSVADEIRQKAEVSKSSGLASRKVNKENISLDEIDDVTYGLLSVDKIFPEQELLMNIKIEDVVEEVSETVPEESLRPVTPLKGLGGGALEGDLEFEDAVTRLTEKFPGLDKRELYRVISGESAFDPTVVNEYNMAGLFQISPESAKRLGVTTKEIAEMSPSEQVDLYGRYLELWDYNPQMSLAVLQAAPAYRNESDDFVVYKKGSKEWKANKPWRPDDGGDITIGSIKDYYGN